MKLTYRGNAYESETIPMEMAGSGVRGSYRGQSLQFAYPRHIPVPQPPHDLQYRGVSYHTTATGEIESVQGAAVETTSTGCRAAMPVPSERVPTCLPLIFQMKKTQFSTLANTHRLNLQRRLQHRMEVARANGNEALLHQLEQEMQQLV